MAVLRVELNKCSSSDWVRAQYIFDEMVALCGCKGPSGMQQTPRSCRACGYYGHTRQYCPKVKDLPRAEGWVHTSPTRDEVSAEDWAYLEECWRILSLVEKLRDLGGGCTDGGEGACLKCEGCIAWRTSLSA